MKRATCFKNSSLAAFWAATFCIVAFAIAPALAAPAQATQAPTQTQNLALDSQTAQEITITHSPGQIEVIFSLSAPYTHAPKSSEQKGYRGVIFPNLHADSKNQSFKGEFLSQVQVFNIDDNLYVLGVGDESQIELNVSKAPNALKVTFSKADATPSELESLLQTPHNAQLPNIEIPSSTKTPESITPKPLGESPLAFKTDLGIDTWRYVAVLVVMAALVLGLWIIKRSLVHKKNFSSFIKSPSSANARTAQPKSSGGFFSSLFGTSSGVERFDPTKIEVVSQKNLDSKHRILTIESNGYRYLILIGLNSTTLIDRYPIPREISHDEQLIFDDQFAKLLEQKQERLSKYLHNKAHE